MKKFVLTTTMVFLTAIYSFSQEIGFGVKAGLSLANLTETSYHVRPGLVIGGFANIRFNDYVALQPELLYAMQDATNVCDFAIGVGLGYETEMGLTAGFRYTISATKAIKDSDPKNSVFQLALGWKF